MKITEAFFITSAASPKQFQSEDKPIIAVAGKSNVGKSSLINMLANRKKLAKTSVTPGRTRLINYFDFGAFILADLPGYGFAKVSKEEKNRWAELLETFFASQKISLLISLVDIRHAPTKDDVDLIGYLNFYRIPFIAVATKADKLSKTRIKPAVKELAAALKMGEANVIASSAQTGLGKEEILAEIEKVITFGEKAGD